MAFTLSSSKVSLVIDFITVEGSFSMRCSWMAALISSLVHRWWTRTPIRFASANSSTLVIRLIAGGRHVKLLVAFGRGARRSGG